MEKINISRIRFSVYGERRGGRQWEPGTVTLLLRKVKG